MFADEEDEPVKIRENNNHHKQGSKSMLNQYENRINKLLSYQPANFINRLTPKLNKPTEKKYELSHKYSQKLLTKKESMLNIT